MRAALKVAVVVAPFLLVFLGLRACARGDADRWAQRVALVDPQAEVAVDDAELLVIAPDPEWGRRAGAMVREFREALVDGYADLVGPGRDRRLVVVLVSTVERLQQLHGAAETDPFGSSKFVHGFTDPQKGAIYLPPESTFSTLRHETVHLVVDLSYGDVVQYSPWVSEGLAQLFERFDPAADPPVPPGLGPEERALARARLGGGFDVARLVAIDDYRDFTGGDVHRNYFEAHVLMAFLLDRDRALLAKYLEAERARTAGRDLLFEEMFRPREPAFARDLQAYLRR